MFPYEIKPIDGEIGKELLERFKGEKLGFVQVGPQNWALTAKYAEHADKYYTFKLRKDDLWVITYPRSGTTWMQEISWLINNDLDYETAAKVPLIERFPFFEFNIVYSDKYLEEVKKLNNYDQAVLDDLELRNTPGYIVAEKLKSPRHMKSHLPFSLLPTNLLDTCKVIYVARNPYDVAVSYYHHNMLFNAHGYQGNFNQYWDLFERDLTLYSPYWDHILEGWNNRNHPNCLFLFYEDLIRDLPSNIKKICTFLNKQMDDEQIKKLADHVHIDNFRKNVYLMKKVHAIGMINPNAQGFIRKGKVGENTEFDENLKKRADKWFNEKLSKTDIKFPKF